MSTPPIDESAPLYSVNERCLCFHGPLIYEAKVLKAQNHDAATTPTGYVGMHYQVHYKGWKQTWDEWVPATRLLKFNEANLATQKALQIAERGRTSAAKKAVPTGSDAKKKDAPRGTKRARGQDEEGDTPAVASASGRQVRDRPDMRVNVPELLKVKLVDDWEAVTKSNQLVTLPRSPNVSQLLDEFEVWVKETEPEHLRDPNLLIRTIVAGLKIYFDRSLGSNLLYRFERQQYAEIRKRYITGQNLEAGANKDMREVYGAEHLLRMLVTLPQIVAFSSMDKDSVDILGVYVDELMRWMLDNADRIFQVEYETASGAYVNLSRS